MFPNVQNSKHQQDASSETSVHTKKQLNLLMKSQIQQLLQSTSWRMMNARYNYEKQSCDKTQFRVRLHHLAIRYCLKREKLGHTLGVIQTGSQNRRHASAPTFEERLIDWTLFEYGRKAKKSAWTAHKNVHTIPDSY